MKIVKLFPVFCVSGEIENTMCTTYHTYTHITCADQAHTRMCTYIHVHKYIIIRAHRHVHVHTYIHFLLHALVHVCYKIREQNCHSLIKNIGMLKKKNIGMLVVLGPKGSTVMGFEH